MEINQYNTEKDAEEFVDLLNLFHTFYKRENDLPTSAHFFDKDHGLKEIQEFKKQSVECGNSYFKFYKKEINQKLLKKYNVIYHLTVNDHYTYTSNNVLKLLTNVLSFNMTNWDIITERTSQVEQNLSAKTSQVEQNLSAKTSQVEQNLSAKTCAFLINKEIDKLLENN